MKKSATIDESKKNPNAINRSFLAQSRIEIDPGDINLEEKDKENSIVSPALDGADHNYLDNSKAQDSSSYEENSSGKNKTKSRLMIGDGTDGSERLPILEENTANCFTFSDCAS